MARMLTLLTYLFVVKGSFFNILPEHSFNFLFCWIQCGKRNPYLLILCCTATKQISVMRVQINMIFLTPLCYFLFSSRGANYLTQILLRPGASDLTGSQLSFLGCLLNLMASSTSEEKPCTEVLRLTYSPLSHPCRSTSLLRLVKSSVLMVKDNFVR